MLITEFRVVLPMTVEEYQVAQLYTVAEASKNETGGGEGVIVLKNEPFENVSLLNGKFTKGQYTLKRYFLASRAPSFLKHLAPSGSMELQEEAWNAYPYCKTVLSNPKYMKENFHIQIETMHCSDRGNTENVHGLDKEKLNLRKVVMIDIADPVHKNDYKQEEDPSKFLSKTWKRGPLTNDGHIKWIDSANPVMTCYKLVTCEFKWFGFQNKAESFIMQTEKRIFSNFHRQLYCWSDKWDEMTMKDVRALEEKTKEELENKRGEGMVCGTKSYTYT